MKSEVRSGSASSRRSQRSEPPAESFPLAGGARRFHLAHAWLPLLAFVVMICLCKGMGGDLWLADRIYAMEGHRWALRDAFFTRDLVHLWGRDLSILASFAVFVAWLVARKRASWTSLRRPLAYLAVTTLVSIALVAWIKSWSNMDCPWDLMRYGGDRPYVGLFALRPIGLERGACFPAGHASGGYAWLSLYFFFLVVRPRWRWFGLAIGGGLGLLFGISQQLRGAHFLSHDVWTAGLCWGCALAIYLGFREASRGI